MTFSASGNFANTGIQTITLQGSGTPINSGPTPIPITAGSSTCSFTIDVGAGGPTGNPDINSADSAWSFTEGTNFYHGPFFDVYDTTRQSVGYGLVFVGYTPATADTVLQMGVLFSGGSIQPGTYSTSTFAAAYYFTDYTDTAHPAKIYVADPTTSNVNTQITISSYDPATQIIAGTFAGTALNNANSTVQISGGKFRAKVRIH
jgi:hypothetical protein